ncbi:MAG: hypothetical protein H3C43_00250 [Leptonema sp. (in: Bacteria)]|nr:hypothetical protein [Leptonema sp. (in: bacteria)]
MNTDKGGNQAERTVDDMLRSWMEYIDFCKDSSFFKAARQDGIKLKEAAVLTLLWTYLNTFSTADRHRIENDSELFYHYAKGFLTELSPFRYHSKGYDRKTRAMFLGKIRNILKHSLENAEREREQYEFFCAIVRFTSSEDYIYEAYDLYRQYIFRFRPKIKNIDFNFDI